MQGLCRDARDGAAGGASQHHDSCWLDTKVHAGTSAVLPSRAQRMAAGLRKSSREGKSICYTMKEA